jgi:ATP-dependent helicase/nuclease subunit A
MAFQAEMVPVLHASGSNDQKLAAKLRSLTGPDLTALEVLEGALLTGSSAKAPFSAKIGSLPTKGLREGALAHIIDRFEALMLRVEDARRQRLGLAAVQRDLALHAFARPFLAAYGSEKERRGWLDFDDLITRTRNLLSDERVANWVLYRLDGGIDHILVDEAQDTSPVQWQVIERLAQEFTSGEGARADVRRTIFVVGDKKQSIYSFQGADPDEFDRMRDEFATRLAATTAPLNSMALQFSFRSAAPILRLVDHVFDGATASGFMADQKHRAFKQDMPGRVDLWPHVEPVKDEEDGAWFEPVDRLSQQHHSVILANRIAGFIAGQIGKPLPVFDKASGQWKARPLHAGDFLILVRSRSRLFAEIIRACKQHALPIAGADRLKVMAELAVRDVVALLSVLATPEDSLALATVLRSPLFGLSEQALFDLAHRRSEPFLWQTLRNRREEFPQVMAVLDDLMGNTDFLRPFDLIERILTRHKGRRLLIGRLGPEAEDGINALLQQALAYERTEVPSLTGFLEWAQSDNLEIKRAPDSAGRTLRVMTMHGAKGLEAPVVILPDCAQPNQNIRDTLLQDDAGLFWRQNADAMPQRQQDTLEAYKQVQARERDRLLYVGMTRAEQWLVVAAAGDLGKQGEGWYEQVARAMPNAGALPAPFDFGPHGAGQGMTLGDADWTGFDLVATDPPQAQAVQMPPELLEPAPVVTAAPKTLAPSDLGGAKALAGAEGDDGEVAKARGSALHSLLEHLAPVAAGDRARVGAVVAEGMADAPELVAVRDLIPDILVEALGVLATPSLAWIFAPETLAEVPVTADLPGQGRLHGILDRLVMTPDKIIVVDYKTNRVVPEGPAQVPEGLLRQMGAYAVALGQIWPDRAIETGILWTVQTSYMPLPHEIVTEALGRATTS